MDRRIKKAILAQPQTVIIEPAPGLAEASLKEIESLFEDGSYVPMKAQPAVSLEDGQILVTNLDYRLAMELCMRLRTIRDLRLLMLDAHAGSLGDLERLWSKLPWEFYLPAGATVSLDVQSFQSKLYHENMIKEHWQQVLVDKGYSVSSDAVYQLQHRQNGNRCKIDLSLAGQDLYKRGYKSRFQTPAPLAEHLAAALLMDYHGQSFDEILVPFAGSGALGVEALLASSRISAGVFGRSYALEAMPCSPEASIRFLRQKLLDEAHQAELSPMSFIDISEEAHQAVCSNMESAKKSLPQLSFSSQCDDFLKMPLDHFQGKSVCLPLNPPYGLRLSQKQSGKGLYHDIAQKLVAIGGVCQSLYSFCLAADDDSYKVYRAVLGDFYDKTRHFNQGGRHIRAVYAVIDAG